MIKLISSKAARILCKDEKHTDNYELYEYALYIILSSLLHIATIIILGLCFNLLVESIVFYLSFIVIRKFAGGYHAKTPTRCYLFSIVSSIVSFNLIIFIENLYGGVIIMIMIELFCIIFIFIISPLDSDNNPLNRNEKKAYRKKLLLYLLMFFCYRYFLLY